MGLLIDTTPLRVSRDFRRLWIGQAVSVFGTTVTTAALPFPGLRADGLVAGRRAPRRGGVGAAARVRGGWRQLRRPRRQAPPAPRRHRDLAALLGDAGRQRVPGSSAAVADVRR